MTGTAHNRKEGILILSGGLTVHNLRNLQSFVQETADPPVIQFNDAVTSAISVANVSFSHNFCLYILVLNSAACSLTQGSPRLSLSPNTTVFDRHIHVKTILCPST